MYLILKCLLSGLIVGLVSEIARRSPPIAAVVASLPLTSILAFIWLHREAKDVKSLIALSDGIALVVLPSILFFVCFSFLLRRGWHFYGSLAAASGILVVGYTIYVAALKRAGWME